MPIRKVTGPRGGKGYQYGESGKYYPGPGGRAKAVRQAQAIKASQAAAAKRKK